VNTRSIRLITTEVLVGMGKKRAKLIAGVFVGLKEKGGLSPKGSGVIVNVCHFSGGGPGYPSLETVHRSVQSESDFAL